MTTVINKPNRPTNLKPIEQIKEGQFFRGDVRGHGWELYVMEGKMECYNLTTGFRAIGRTNEMVEPVDVQITVL